jgi:AcrR family transcriptional regulator
MDATDTLAAPLGGRREKRKQEIRQRIETAAYALFRDQGIEETSIEQICQRADVARRTFYGHYPNRQALLRALSQSRVFGTADAMLREVMDNHGSTRSRMSAMIDYMENSIAGYSALDRELVLVIPIASENTSHMRDVSLSIQDQFTEIFRLGQQRGDTSKAVSADMLAQVVVGTINNLMINWALDTAYPIHDKLEEARGLFERVVCVD